MMIAHSRRLLLSLALAAGGALPLSAQTEPPPVALSPAENQFLDVLVVYTPAARAQAGSTTAMTAEIRSYIALANTCFANSEVIMRLRLAGTAEVAYTETFGGTMNADLNWLSDTTYTSNSTNFLLRRATGADLVCLVRRGPVGGTTGVADSNGCFVVADNHATATLAFPHEIGHVMGLKHDRASEGIAGEYNYSCAHIFTGNDGILYRTVMANGPGIRIPYFSNPWVNYQGVPTGIAFPAIDASDHAMILDHPFENGTIRWPIADILLPGNFSGDGTAELILAGANYQCRFWDMNGVVRTSTTDMADAFTGVWTPFGTGDLDGDGKSDVLFKAADGRIAVWFMNGSSRSSAAVLPDIFLPSVWAPFGAGDLNSDGKDDLLFRCQDGRIAVWYMNGATRTSATVLAERYTSWYAGTYSLGAAVPFGVGDLNGDGHDDILLSTDKAICVCFLNGSTRTSAGSVPLLFGNIWTPVGAADYDGDGKDDIVFKSTDERGAIWFMNGTTRVSSDVFSHRLNTL